MTHVPQDRLLLLRAQQAGTAARCAAYLRLSGPGWLQSAITLGGGSLSSALFLGVLCGTGGLWVQLLSISLGVVMLAAIGYVTLSTQERPLQAINRHINPALGWGWVVATVLANMIWCMPQFSLAFDSLQKNLMPEQLHGTLRSKLAVSSVLLVLAGIMLVLNRQRGWASYCFDLVLKSLVGLIVICFVGVVVYLSRSGQLDWPRIWRGFVPNPGQWRELSGPLEALFDHLDANTRSFWRQELLGQQRAVMISAAATAVGVNMTFLLPYSLLQRGWDKPFRGLARMDLIFGMALPYILVTSCVAIASAAAFHAQADERFLSRDPQVMQQSPLAGGRTVDLWRKRLAATEPPAKVLQLTAEQVWSEVAELATAEKQLAAAAVKRNAFQLARSLAPLLGERWSNRIFGVGALAMGFSTIIILMLINGFAFNEVMAHGESAGWFYTGGLVAGVAGASWPLIWGGQSELWLSIAASTFGAILLPVAYIAFFCLMNNRRVLGDDLPRGWRRWSWNGLMLAGVAVAFTAAGSSIATKLHDPRQGMPVLVIVVGYSLLVIAGFFVRRSQDSAT